MTRNVGLMDKRVRIVLSIALVIIGIILSQSAGIVALIVPVVIAAILMTTVMLNWCPIYAVIRFSTFKKSEN